MSIDNNTQTLSMSASAPPPVSQASGTYSGAPFTGSLPIFYWVVARYPVGLSQPFGPIAVTGTPGVAGLSASNSVLISWQPVSGATSYDVIRSTTNAYPVPGATCAISLANGGNSYVDQGGAGGAYPPAGIDLANAANASIQIDNRSQASPSLIITLDGSSGLLPVVLGGAPTVGNCAQWGAEGKLVDSGFPCGGSGSVSTGVPLTAGLPVIGAGSSAIAIGTRQGNTTKYISAGAGSPALNDYAKYDADGNLVTGGAIPAGTTVTINDPFVTIAGALAGPINAITDPGVPAWAWVNQGAATITVTNGAQTIFQPADNTTNLKMRVVNAPATPYTVTGIIKITTASAANSRFGLCFYESATQKVGSVSLNPTSAGNVKVDRWTNPTNYSATSADIGWVIPGMTYFRLADNGTNITYSMSVDGIYFYPVLTELRGAWFTTAPNQIGFFLTTANATFPGSITLFSWLVA